MVHDEFLLQDDHCATEKDCGEEAFEAWQILLCGIFNEDGPEESEKP